MRQRVAKTLLGAACTAAAWIYCSSAESAPSHRFAVTGVQVTDLGTLGGGRSSALDINDAGEIVGWAATAQGIQHAFLYSNGMMDDIGGSAFGPAASYASGINNARHVVGTMTDQFGTAGFVWISGGVSWLPPLFSTVPRKDTHGEAINDDDDVCGATTPTNLRIDAIRWVNLSPSFLPGTASFNAAHDINSSGNCVGYQLHKTGTIPVLWTTTAVSPQLVPPPAFTSGYGEGDALAINDRGEVVGHYLLDTGMSSSMTRAYFWDGVSPNSQELGLLPAGSNSDAEDINEFRFIAGHADERIVRQFFDVVHERAFLAHRDIGLYALPALPATSWLGSCRAFALNEWRSSSSLIQVVGACDTPAGSHAVRWDITVPLVRVMFSPPR